MKAHKIVLVVAFICVAILFNETNSAPQESPAAGKWAHLRVVSYAAGLTGFFDTTDDTLYLYAADVKTPFMITQLETLGEPMKVIKGMPGQ